MGEKEGEKKQEGGGSITIVYKVDMHCDGCAKKIKKSVKKYDGVETVEGDSSTNKLTVKGKVDPTKLRERIEHKTHKKVELISPQPKKQEGGEKKDGDEKKKEPSVQTVVLKIRLHCDGCTQRIRKIISKFKGVYDVAIDSQKDLVTVKGIMDMKALQPYLKEKLKRSVDIVPPKKEEGDKKEGGGDKKEAGGGDKKDEGDKKEAGGKGDGGKKEGGKMEGNKLEYYGQGNEHGYGYNYGNGFVVEYVHAPQIFSDENPNACSIM
ncbi:hypothetical protein IFM89_028943 [Coptis chinensis]|uniref:HMA domain-containing protein n=1 Tax=Coptis chinensis TaxID=261450 RepID=A0A835H6S1_9MAGN|nr:hypothetical protein IFM89_028943 [Coptis chinensis]